MAVDNLSKITQVLYQNRFCDQEDYDVIISGSTDHLEHFDERESLRLSSPYLNKIETIYHSKRHWYSDRTICERSNVWTVCSKIQAKGESHIRSSFKIYLDKTDQWMNVVQVPDGRRTFSACSFMKNIYVFGGFKNKISLKSCYKYYTKPNVWKFIAPVNVHRQVAGCTVFKGKIVLTGGFDGYKDLKSVEAYDWYKNKWEILPCMIKERHLHGSVSMGNKLFVIGGKYNATCEVFDSSSMKFTSIKQLDRNCYLSISAVSIGDKISVFGSNQDKGNDSILTFNVDKNEWYCKKKLLFKIRKRFRKYFKTFSYLKVKTIFVF